MVRNLATLPYAQLSRNRCSSNEQTNWEIKPERKDEERETEREREKRVMTDSPFVGTVSQHKLRNDGTSKPNCQPEYGNNADCNSRRHFYFQLLPPGGPTYFFHFNSSPPTNDHHERSTLMHDDNDSSWMTTRNFAVNLRRSTPKFEDFEERSWFHEIRCFKQKKALKNQPGLQDKTDGFMTEQCHAACASAHLSATVRADLRLPS